MLDEKHYRRSVRAARFGEWLAQRASKRNKGWLDRVAYWLLRRALKPADPAQDFMRDPLLDAEPEFDPAELATYQQSKQEDSV